MEKAPLAEPNNGQVIFAALRDILAELYAEESTARTVVHDAGLDAKQIPFSARAQTNWHNILAEAIRQARLDPLLKIALADYAANPALLAAYGQYRLWIEQDGYLEAPASLSADASVTIAGNVNLNQGDFVGHDKLIAGDDVGGDKVEDDKIDAHGSQGFLNHPTAPVTQHFGTSIHLGHLKISKPIVGILFTSLVAVVLFIGAIALYARNMSEAITAPTPTPTSTIPTATPTRTPLPTATPLAFATQAVSETLIVIATFHNTAATNSEAHTKIRRAIADAATSNNEQQLRVEVEPTELTADQRIEAEALGKQYNASMVIWGEDTGVEVIVNFLNLKESNIPTAAATITERERTQLANPSAYARFITQDLPQTMSFWAFFTVGQSYYLNAQYILAIERIEAAVTLVTSAPKPVGLGDAYFRLGWLYQVSIPANLNQAIAYYDKAIQFNFDDAMAYNNRGNAFYDQEKLDEAIDNYDQAIRLDPNLALAYFNRGKAFYNQEKLEDAIADFDQAIHLNSDFEKAYNDRGIAHYDQGKLDDAIIDFDQAIHLNPGLAEAYNNRGAVRYDQNKLDEAIANYDQAIHLNPGLAEAYSNRGAIRYEQGKLDDAIADFDQAIKLKSDYANAFGARGVAYRNLGKPKEALADFRRYLELQPNGENRVQVEQWIAEIEAELAKLK